MNAKTADDTGISGLSPTMVSRRLLVLAFVQEYIGRWGTSPSYGEIARGCQTNTTRVKEALRSLVREGQLLRKPGARGLALPDQRDAAVRMLRELGYLVYDERAVTNPTLLAGPMLDYDPVHGREIIGKESSQDGAAKAA